MQIPPAHAGQVGRQDSPRASARSAGQKIPHQLCRRRIRPGRGGIEIRFSFDFALPEHPGERPFPGEILRMQRHKQCCIGVCSAPAGVAHPVGAYSARFAGCGKDIAARAHAEGIGACPARQVDAQGIVRRGEQIHGFSVLCETDFPLKMLDPRPHGKGLALHRDSLGIQVFKRITRGMPDSEDCPAAGDRIISSRARHFQSCQRITVEAETFQPGFKADLPA